MVVLSNEVLLFFLCIARDKKVNSLGEKDKKSVVRREKDVYKNWNVLEEETTTRISGVLI